MILLFFFLLFSSSLNAFVHFVVVTPSYNNERYCIDNIRSIQEQTYPYWKWIFVNDCSTDRTGHLIEEYVRINNLQGRCKIIHNEQRKGAMYNLYKVIKKLPPHVVVVNLDGDDKLAHPRVLEHLASVYENENIWLTYGNYRSEPVSVPSVCRPFPFDVMKKRQFRSFIWSSSHPKTYYAALFQKIKSKDLKYKGEYVSVASDVAFMMPMLEMASQGHIHFISDPLYVYNYENPLNDNAVHGQYVLEVERAIRQKKRYKALEELSLTPQKKRSKR